MGSPKAILSTIAGTVIGFFVGGPAGALKGPQLGITFEPPRFAKKLPDPASVRADRRSTEQ